MTKKQREEIEKMVKDIKYYDVERFISDAKTYLKAVKDGRILYNVDKVSQNGMSRTIFISSCERCKNRFSYRNYDTMLEVLGYKFDKDSYAIRVHGCGMNMLFATNYDIIGTFKRLGLINQLQFEILSQEVN